jgi:hypothetical protein
MARLLVVIWFLMNGAAIAADQSFANREDMMSFVDEHMLQREFGPLIRRLDGGGEYSDDDINKVATNLRHIYPQDFTSADRIRYREMDNGFYEEVLAFWRPGGKYIFLYIFSHEASDGVYVLTFGLNSRAEKVLSLFH